MARDRGVEGKGERDGEGEMDGEMERKGKSVKGREMERKAERAGMRERERHAGVEEEEEWNSTTYFFLHFAIQTRGNVSG